MDADKLTFENFDDFFNLGNAEQGEEARGGLRCELKKFEARYNSKGERVVLNVGSRKALDPPRDSAHDSAMVLTTFYNKEQEAEYTELEIQSPHIKAALKEVVPQYRDLNLRVKKIVLRDQPRCLFHYRNELQKYGSALQDPEASTHLLFALRYTYMTLQSEIHSYYNLIETTSIPPSIDFLNLWMVFRPGDYIYTRTDDVDRVLKFKDMSRCKCPIPWCISSKWTITADTIDYNGTDFGYTTARCYVRPYDGYKVLKDLRVMPLRYHPDPRPIISAAVRRGKKFIGLHGMHHRMYKGIAEVLAADRRTSLMGEEDEFPLRSIRIIVDAKTFSQARPSHEAWFSSNERIIRTENDDHLRLTNDDYLICHHLMPGFALVDKRWCYFRVDLIKDVEYNSEAFGALMLEKEQKDMILSLVKIHTDERLSFDDVIKGKGKGMVFLLHGVPGVGKTLTAESVADFCKRPLYTISAGDLGPSPSTVEEELGAALRLATTWNAVILIDEADVFLEQRSAHDLRAVKTNTKLAFLRILEYYEGIMFLTTNRIGSFDEAVKSRIHLAIKYPILSTEARTNLWRTFISRTFSGSSPSWVTSESLARLAGEDLNGWQIKDIVRTAHALAVSKNRHLGFDQIRTALRAMKTFETDLAEDATRRKAEESGLTAGEQQTSKRQRTA
ncbi:hypothetical protein FGG08_003908 [Glutinoglossum americanum]|uniref:AAA+ ATPase domain-containing protein n=1 Tax=Glutinoglossum americanum TaxID=1670608 RepID=A0A9P8I1I5_9PEZI|nr:hypothetical protein FGG08_003908 [Glutinoglossum americanum]